MVCNRCHKDNFGLIMSRMICFSCENKEKKHQDYEKARVAEFKAVQRGDYNFKGIGKPIDL